jgi:broad specificity phosphatase PhoE
MNLFFVRHGQSEANVIRIFSNRGIKHGLTDKGKQQAAKVANSLSEYQIDAVYSSTLLRAQQTAEAISGKSCIPYTTTDSLLEIDFGILEGRYYHDKDPHFSNLMLSWFIHKNYDYKIEESESYSDVKDRFVPFIENLKNSSKKNIVLVGHGALFRFMLPEIFTNIDHSYSTNHLFGNTDYAIGELAENNFICKYWCGNNISH